MKRYASLLVLCALAASACDVQPAFPVLPTVQITLPSQTFTPTFTQTPLPTLIPANTATITPPPLLSFSPIFYRHYVDRYYSFQVLGGFQNGSWLNDVDAFEQLQFDELHDVYGPDGFVDSMEIEDAYNMVGATSLEMPPYCSAYYIGSNLGGSAGTLFGFAREWRVTIRPVIEQSVNTPVYRQAVEDWLISQGIAQPEVNITSILRVDIEGDGADEVFIAATRFKSPDMPITELGDYSIILMRKVDGNTVVTIPVVADVYHSAQSEPTYPLTYILSEFIDLNQDANLEVVVHVTRWEGAGIIVYEVKDKNIIQALTEICAE